MYDLSRFRVIYGERVLNAIALDRVDFGENDWPGKTAKSIVRPKFLSVVAINEDGNVVFIYDEAWMFQFVPIVKKEE